MVRIRTEGLMKKVAKSDDGSPVAGRGLDWAETRTAPTVETADDHAGPGGYPGLSSPGRGPVLSANRSTGAPTRSSIDT
jgi:hypothetical protein